MINSNKYKYDIRDLFFFVDTKMDYFIEALPQNIPANFDVEGLWKCVQTHLEACVLKNILHEFHQ